MPEEISGPTRQPQDRTAEIAEISSRLVALPAAALDLIAAIRDDLPLEPQALDELLDMQPSPQHAKALLCGLASRGIIRPEDAEIAMIDRELGGA